jgi:hypothetical protein
MSRSARLHRSISLSLSLLLSGASALLGGPARAEIRDLLSLLQGGLAEAPQSLGQSAPRQLLLNGFPLRVLVGRSLDSPRQVTDHFARSCSHSRGGGAPAHREDGTSYSLLLGVQGEADSLKRRMAATRQHYVHLAPLCMAYAHRSEDATDYLAVWTDAPLPESVLSPSPQSDAPGSDVPGVPRPSGSVRSFSLVEPAAGYRVAAYAVENPPAVALRETVNQLAQSGFSVDAAFSRSARDRGRLIVRLERTGRDLLVSAQPLRSSAQGSLILYLARAR